MREAFCLHLAIFRGAGRLPWGGLHGFFRLPRSTDPGLEGLVVTELLPGQVGLVAGTSGQQRLEHMTPAELQELGLGFCTS